MKKRSLILAIALALGVGGFCTLDARADSATLASLIASGQEISIGGGLQVMFTAYAQTTPNAPTASSVTIEWAAGSGSPFPGPGGTTNYGFLVDGSFSTTAGNSLDAGMSYIVSSISGKPIITDAYAFVDASPTGVGIGSATDTLSLSSGATKFSATSEAPPQPGDKNPNEITFAGQSSISVHKDIFSSATTGVTLFSTIQQGFSTQAVPEPSTFALLGIGMTGFLAFRRFFKKASVA
jgi:hypothetical protein